MRYVDILIPINRTTMVGSLLTQIRYNAEIHVMRHALVDKNSIDIEGMAPERDLIIIEDRDSLCTAIISSSIY